MYRPIALGLLLLLVALGTGRAEVIDDFESGTLSGWTAGTCGGWTIVSPGHNSTYAVKTTGTVCCGASADHLLIHGSFQASYGRYSYDVFFPAGANIQNGDMYIQLQGYDRIWCFLGPVGGDNIDGDQIQSYIGGIQTVLDCTPIHLTTGVWHTVEIERYPNGVIRLLTDGVLQLEGYEPGLATPGTVALVAHSTGVEYDNLTFDPTLPPDPPLPGPPSCTATGMYVGCADLFPVGPVLPTLQLVQIAVSVNETDPSVAVTVQRVGSASGAVTVDYATADGSATAGSDYTAVSGTLTFGDGDTTPQTILIPILDDALPEGGETFTLSLSNPTGGALLARPTCTITILDDEDPGVLQMSYLQYFVTEGPDSVAIIVSRVGGSYGAVSVDYATADAEAVAGSDYVATSGTVMFGNGDATPKTIKVPLINDAVFEPTETFSISLSNPVGGAGLGSDASTIVVYDDDNPGAFYLSSSQSVSENLGPVVLTVSRYGGLRGTISVDYTTADGSAMDGSDYVATSGTLTFGDGDTTPQTISVPLVDDAVFEPTETFFVTLSNPTGGSSLGQASSTITVLDDDNPGTLGLSNSTYAVTENLGPATLTVLRTGGSRGSVSVDFTTGDGGAVSGSDYVATSGTVTFDDGDATPKAIDVPLVDDGVPELAESFVFSLSNPTGGASLGTSSADVVVTDDDYHGSFQLSSLAYQGTEASGSIVVTLLRTGNTSGSVSVDYTTSSGSATAGLDYAAVSGTAMFGDGESLKTIVVPIFLDDIIENQEDFTFTLSNPTGGSLLGSPSSASLQILDSNASARPVIATHLRTTVSKSPCTSTFGSIPTDCRDAVTTGNVGEGYYLYLILDHDVATGLAGVQLGIDYSGDDLYLDTWNSCASMEFPSSPDGLPQPPANNQRPHPRLRRESTPVWTWPGPNSGNRLTFGGNGWGCVNTTPAALGSFYVYAYAPTTFRVTPWPFVDNTARVVHCDASNNVLDDLALGYAGFGMPGCNPCQPEGSFPPPSDCTVVTTPITAQVSWAQVADATAYRVYRDNDWVVSVPAAALSFTDHPPAGTYLYSVRSESPCEISVPCTAMDSVLVGVEEDGVPPRFGMQLLANPVRTRSTVRFETIRRGPVDIRAFDISGRLVRVLVDDFEEAGVHEVTWDGRDAVGAPLPSGVYLVSMNANGRSSSVKLVLIQ